MLAKPIKFCNLIILKVVIKGVDLISYLKILLKDSAYIEYFTKLLVQFQIIGASVSFFLQIVNTMSIPVRVKKEDKTEDSAKNLYITVKVTSQMNELDPCFRVRCDEPLRHLMIRWCARADVADYKTVRFLDPEGGRMNENKTIDESGIQNGDCIDAMMEQTGA